MKNKNKPKEIVKTKEYGKKLVPINSFKVKDLNFYILPREKNEIVYNTIVNTVIGLAGFNPVLNISIPKGTLTSEVNFDTESFFGQMQKISTPIDARLVNELLQIPKYCIKCKTLSKPENSKTSTEEKRMLLVGKRNNGEYVCFQLNLKYETIEVKGKQKDVLSTNFGAILGGKIYSIFERYDNSVHHNLVYDGNKNLTDIEEKKIISNPHLHYVNKRFFVSLFNALQEEGYNSDEILTSRIMTKQEAIPFTNFNNAKEAENFFLKRYNIRLGFEKYLEKTMSVGSFCDTAEEKASKIFRKKQENKYTEIYINNDEKPKKPGKKFYYNNSREGENDGRDY